MVLMVRLFWVFFFLGFGLAVSAQDDPVLMRINGKEVLRSEFERSYNKGGTSVGAGRKALDAYVNKFIDFRLKIEAAEVAGLDNPARTPAGFHLVIILPCLLLCRLLICQV